MIKREELEQQLSDVISEIDFNVNFIQSRELPIDYTIDLCYFINTTYSCLEELERLRGEYADITANIEEVENGNG